MCVQIFKEKNSFIHFLLLFRCNCERSNMNVDMIDSPQRRRGYLSAIEGTAATPEPSTR
jgi:hypothetical protein